MSAPSTHHPTRPLNSLGPPLYWRLFATSLVAAASSSQLSSNYAVLCCICVRDLISAGVCCLVGGSEFERSCGSRLIETAGHPTVSPSSSASFSFPLIQPQWSAVSVHWLSASICTTLNSSFFITNDFLFLPYVSKFLPLKHPPQFVPY